MRKPRFFSNVTTDVHNNLRKFKDPKLQEIFDRMTIQAEKNLARLNKDGIKPIKIDPVKLDEAYDKAEKSYEKFSVYD